MEVVADSSAGTIRCRLKKPLSEKGELLMESMILGLSHIAEQYGEQYLTLKFKEV